MKTPSFSPLSAFVGTSASSIVVTIMTFVSGVIIARALGPAARGEYGAILIVTQTVATLGTFSYFDAAVVLSRQRRISVQSVFPTLFAASIAFAGLSIGITIIILNFFTPRFDELSPLFVTSFTVATLVIYILLALLISAERASMRFNRINISRIISPFSFCIFVVFFVYIFDGNNTLFSILILFLCGKIFEVACFSNLFAQMIGKVQYKFGWETLALGIRLYPAAVLALISAQFDRLYAISAWARDLLGQYMVAFSAVGAGYAVLNTGLNTILLPYFSGSTEEERAGRIMQVLRVTMLAIFSVIVLGYFLLPLAIPIVYGADFGDSSEYAVWLLLALSPQPIRIIMLEASRSFGHGWPSTEMALTSIAIMLVMYFLTGYESPNSLIVAFGLSNLAAVIVGARHLLRNGDLQLGWGLVPGPDDIRLIGSIAKRTIQSWRSP